MFKVDVTLYFNVEVIETLKKTVYAETREDIEARAEEIVKECSIHGFLRDDDENDWYYIPTHSIKCLRFEFGEEETNGSTDTETGEATAAGNSDS